MGYAVDQRQVTDLPLLVTHAGAAHPGVVTLRRASPAAARTFFNANGNFATWNNFMLDGRTTTRFDQPAGQRPDPAPVMR